MDEWARVRQNGDSSYAATPRISKVGALVMQTAARHGNSSMTHDNSLDEMLAVTNDPVRWAFAAGVRLLGARRASLLLRNGREMRVAASVGLEPSVVSGVRVPLGQGIAGLVAERNVVLFGEADGMRFISVPIVDSRTVRGVLNLTNREGHIDFEDGDVTRARELAGHLGYLLALQAHGGVDAISGLLNRYAFDESLEREVARSNRTPSGFALILVVVLGLADARLRVGDDLIDAGMQRVGAALRSHTRPYDAVGRYAEDTCALLFPGATSHGDTLALRATDAVKRGLEGVDIDLALQVACVHYPDDGQNAPDLVTRAYERLQVAGIQAT